MMIFWLLVLIVLVLAVVGFARRERWGGGDGASAAYSDGAERVLRERYARGEIDEETFRRMRAELRANRD